MASPEKKLTRRDFLRLAGAAGVVGALSAGCKGAGAVFETTTPEKPTPKPTQEPTVKPSPTHTDTPIPSPEFLPPVGGEKPEATDTPKPTETPKPTFTPEPTLTPEPLSTFKEVLFLNPGGMSDIGGVSPKEIQDQEDKIKVLEAAGMIPEAPEKDLSLIWFRSGEGSWTAWATKIYSADKEAEEEAGNPGVWVLKENQWQKKETPLKFVSGYKFCVSVEGSGLPPRYLGREEGKVDWVLEKDPLEDPAAQASSLETAEKTGVALFWGKGDTLFAVFGAVSPYLPEGKVRVKAEYLAAPTFLLKEGDLAIVMEDKERNPVGWWNLEKGGWTSEPKNGVEYEDLFEEPEPTPTPEPKLTGKEALLVEVGYRKNQELTDIYKIPIYQHPETGELRMIREVENLEGEKEVIFALEHIHTPRRLNVGFSTSEGVVNKIGGKIALNPEYFTKEEATQRSEGAVLFAHMLHWAREQGRELTTLQEADNYYANAFLPALEKARANNKDFGYNLPYNNSKNEAETAWVEILKTPVILERRIVGNEGIDWVAFWEGRTGSIDISKGLRMGINKEDILEIVVFERLTGVSTEIEEDKRDYGQSCHWASHLVQFANWPQTVTSIRYPRPTEEDRNKPRVRIDKAFVPKAWTEGQTYDDPKILRVVPIIIP